MKLDDALDKLRAARKRLETEQGRIARRNARRAFLGAVKGVKNALDRDFQSVAKPSKPRLDPLEAAAQREHWRDFEKRMKIRQPWNPDLARKFNEWLSAKDGHEAKPIVFDFNANTKRWLGMHRADRISLMGSRDPEEVWRTLLHELAHYKISHHRRAFTEELYRVYELWNQFNTLTAETTL